MNREVPGRLWHSTATTVYNAVGGRDVLILAPKLSLPHPEAVARRPGQLTKEDNLKLQRQGLPPDCKDELDVIKARWKLDRRLKIVGVRSEQPLSREDVIKNITHCLNTTQNYGGKIIITTKGLFIVNGSNNYPALLSSCTLLYWSW